MKNWGSINYIKCRKKNIFLMYMYNIGLIMFYLYMCICVYGEILLYLDNSIIQEMFKKYKKKDM